MITPESRRELADLLRARRAELQPDDVGIPKTGRRRTPGLRREEVSQLSAVSLTWYTWMEQARDINVSRQVLDSVARALQLSPAEADHLAALAGHDVGRVPSTLCKAPDSLRLLLDAINPNPAYVISHRWDIVEWNRAYEVLFGEIATVVESDRNLLWLVFTNASVQSLVVDWETEARRLMAQFRAETGHLLAEQSYRDLVDRLTATSERFAAWWSRHDVAYFTSRPREFRHPEVGDLRFHHHKLSLADHPELRLIVYTPAGDPGGHLALQERILERGPLSP